MLPIEKCDPFFSTAFLNHPTGQNASKRQAPKVRCHTE